MQAVLQLVVNNYFGVNSSCQLYTHTHTLTHTQAPDPVAYAGVNIHVQQFIEEIDYIYY